MSLVEGFGDEVIAALIVFAIVTLLLLAWMSTGVHDQPLISVIVVDGQHFQRILQRISNLTFRPIQITRLGGGGHSSDTGTARSDGVENVESAETETTVAASDVDSNETSSAVVPENEEVHPDNTNAEDDGTSVDGTVDSAPEPQQEKTSESTEETKIVTDARSDSRADNDNCESVNGSKVPETHSDPEPVTADDSEIQDEGNLRIRLKYLDDRQRLVHANPEDTVGDFKRKFFGRELAENLMVRFIYNGQELRQDANTLQAYNVSDNSVIHCLFSSRPSQESPPRQHSLIPEDWDAGYLMFPLFGVILGITWYFRIVYRTYFNAMSTFSLIGITFLFFIALLASIRSHEDEELID